MVQVTKKRIAVGATSILVITFLVAISSIFRVPIRDIRAEFLNNESYSDVNMFLFDNFTKNEIALITRTPNPEHEFYMYDYRNWTLNGYIGKTDKVFKLETRIYYGSSLMWRSNSKELNFSYDKDSAIIINEFDVVMPHTREYLANVRIVYDVYPFKTKPRIIISNATTNNLWVQLRLNASNHADGERIDMDYGGATNYSWDDLSVDWLDNVSPSAVYKFGNGVIQINYPRGEYDIDPTITIGGTQIDYLLVSKSHPAWDERLGKYYYSDITSGDLPLAFKFDKNVNLTKDKVASLSVFDINKKELNLTQLKVTVGINRTYERAILNSTISYNVIESYFSNVTNTTVYYNVTKNNHTYVNVTDWYYVYYNWKDYDYYVFQKDVWYILNFHGEWEARLGNFAVDIVPQINSYNFNEYAWWNSSWQKRRPLTITHGTTSIGAGWQVFTNVTNVTNMLAACLDCRVIDNDNTTSLAIWSEPGRSVNGSYYYVWNKLDSAGNQTAWLYYNNSAATDVRSISDVFLYSNFEFGVFDKTGWVNLSGGIDGLDNGDHYRFNLTTTASSIIGYQTEQWPNNISLVQYIRPFPAGSIDTNVMILGWNASTAIKARFSFDSDGSTNFTETRVASGGGNNELINMADATFDTFQIWDVQRLGVASVEFIRDDGSLTNSHSTKVPAGNFNWEIFLSNTFGMLDIKYGYVRNITADGVEPAISVGAQEDVPVPTLVVTINDVDGNANNTVTTDNTPPINFSADSNSDTTFTCELFVDSSASGINFTVVNVTDTIISVNVSKSDGTRFTLVRCNDSSLNDQDSAEWSFIVETEVPDVILDSPANESSLVIGSQIFNFTAIDEVNNSMIAQLVINDTINATNSSVFNNTITEFNVSGLPAGNHSWYVNVTDSSGTNKSEVRILIVSSDITDPIVNITSPENISYTNLSLPLTFDLIETNEDSCLYSLNGANNVTITCDNNTVLSGFAEGLNNITVYANDTVNNWGADTEFFTIAPEVSINFSLTQDNFNYTWNENDGEENLEPDGQTNPIGIFNVTNNDSRTLDIQAKLTAAPSTNWTAFISSDSNGLPGNALSVNTSDWFTYFDNLTAANSSYLWILYNVSANTSASFSFTNGAAFSFRAVITDS